MKKSKGLVYASRTVLIMLLVAALVVLGLGLAIVILGDPPETGGWLRAIFGKVFAIVAASMAAILGIPAAIGLWAMAGATAEGATPALSPRARQVVAVIAIATVVVTAGVLLVTGSGVRILNLGLLGLVALASLGLAGGSAFSTHRGRAIVSGVALVLVSIGTAWVLNTAFIGSPITA
jgi:hypothetical protein